MINMICHCGELYQATLGDLRRGWGLSCGRPCAGSRRISGIPAAKRADGEPINIKKPLKKARRLSQAANTRHLLKGVG